MHCSHCGFENPANHRFCGMCGTPLPQRPIPTPAAQSTLSLTRLPIDVPHQASSTLSNYAPPGTPAAVEDDAATSKSPLPVVKDSALDSAAPMLEDATPGDPALTESEPSSPPVKSYFTDAQEAESLEQFIAGFRYTPPTETEEVSMTGDKPALDAGVEYEPPTPVSLSDQQASATEPPITDAPETVEPPAPTLESITEQPPPFATKSLHPLAAEPSRLLDLSVPVTQEASGARAPAIQGLSVLGLNDPLSAPRENEEAEQVAPRRGRWWIWVALIVMVALAALGLLRWRAKTYQLDLGPLGTVKTQVEGQKSGQKAGATAPASQTASPNPTNDTTPPANKPANQGSNDTPAPQPK